MIQTARRIYQLTRWNLRGRPAPPPHTFKQRVIRQYGKRFGVEVFVETGTYLGEMVEAMKPHFNKVYSIELSDTLFERAAEAFAADENVRILHGDSADRLPEILDSVSEPCLFWLDGHFSGGVTAQGADDYPILKELEHIGRHGVKRHVILIDDARLFLGTANAPSREEVRQAVRNINPAYHIEERDDIIRAYVDPA